jgi:SAM-dependent methyltransferase
MNTESKEPEFTTEHFARVDQMPDEMFYSMPRLVTHIDEAACAALSAFYQSVLHNGDVILDLMSSCVSHLPASLQPGKVVGQGMNSIELEANPQLDEFFVQNLNKSPVLPFDDNAYDACLIAVSVQYLVDPVSVFAQIGRVLKPGGVLTVSFSNRMFPTKAVAIWRAMDDAGHGRLAATYLRRSERFSDIEIGDISPDPRRSDPLYVVTGRAV